MTTEPTADSPPPTRIVTPMSTLIEVTQTHAQLLAEMSGRTGAEIMLCLARVILAQIGSFDDAPPDMRDIVSAAKVASGRMDVILRARDEAETARGVTVQ